ncbi:hypothetical protein M405DRAFT_867983 [Rhizopogon salebrosus TDB-379]|nr:hypothetical protein M405DRAFT_867983 [Rhizopogon salebrosus TDB-379]
MSTLRRFTSVAFVESLRAQDMNWNMDRYFDHRNICGVEGLVSPVPSPMHKLLSTNSTTQPTLICAEYQLSVASVRESSFHRTTHYSIMLESSAFLI